jgi:CheY-like chemotaxis protein
MKSKLCFIDDDSDFEIPLFRETFGSEFDVITSTTFTEAVAEIEDRHGWTPDLFVLDMYFPVAPPDQLAIAKLAESWTGLQPDDGQIRQAFLNHLTAANRLRQVLSAWNQSAEGGRELARLVSEKFPLVPIVFYSRKATLQDAVRSMMVKNVANVILKPSAGNDEDTKRLTKAEAARIASEFKNAMKLSRSPKLAAFKRGLRAVVKLLWQFFSDQQ